MEPGEGSEADLMAPATMGDIKAISTHVSSEIKDLRELMLSLMQGKNPTSPTPTDLAPVVTPSNGDNNEVASLEADRTHTEKVNDPTKANVDDPSKKILENYNSVPHVYSPDPPIPHPHLVHQGHGPPLTPKSFSDWQIK